MSIYFILLFSPSIIYYYLNYFKIIIYKVNKLRRNITFSHKLFKEKVLKNLILEFFFTPVSPFKSDTIKVKNGNDHKYI